MINPSGIRLIECGGYILRHDLKMDSQQKKDFEKIVMEQKSTIYSVCFMFASSREEADDLFQEVLLNLWNGFGKFRGVSSPRTWVYRVSLNTCISYKRKKKIKTSPLEISDDVIAGDTPQSRQSKQLHKRISKLEPLDRAIVLLWLEDLPYDEIASIVGVSTGSLGMRLMRIKEKLKSL